MANSPEFVTHLLDALMPLGGVTARPMFGGHGLFREGLMFALLAEDALYFKVDGESRPEYEAAGSEPFAYRRAGKPAQLATYWRAREEALDDPDALCDDGRQAFAAALRARGKR